MRLMDKLPHAAPRSEADGPSAPLATLKRNSALSFRAKVFTIMAVTTTMTFATLVTGYQSLFSPHPFA